MERVGEQNVKLQNLDSNTHLSNKRGETLNVRDAVRYSDGLFYEDINRRISHLDTFITVTQTHTHRVPHHLSGEKGLLLSQYQKSHSPAHGRRPQQRNHLLLTTPIKIHPIDL